MFSLTAFSSTAAALTAAPPQEPNFWALFATIVMFAAVIGAMTIIIRLLLGERIFGPNEQKLYEKTQMMRHNAKLETLYDYDLLADDVRAVRKLCKEGSFYHTLIGNHIDRILNERWYASLRHMPFCSAKQLANAQKVLGITADYKQPELDAAIKGFRDRYNPESLKARNAPGRLRTEAQKRLAEAEKAYLLLVRAPTAL